MRDKNILFRIIWDGIFMEARFMKILIFIFFMCGLSQCEIAAKDAKVMHPETTVHLGYDDNYFYAGFRCEEPVLKSIPKRSLWQEGIEIFLDINHDKKTFFQIGITPGCEIGFPASREYHNEFKSEEKIKIKTSYDKKFWFAEIAIPFESMGIKCPSPETVWGINLCRTRRGVYGTWPLLSGIYGFHDPESFAELHFDGSKDYLHPGSSSGVIAVRKISSPIVVDGKLEEDVWKKSAKTGSFVLYPKVDPNDPRYKKKRIRKLCIDSRIKKQVPRAKIMELVDGRYKEHGYTGMFTKEDFELIKEYIKKYPWAGEAFEKIKKDADYWASKSDEELYNFIPPENPRAYSPCYSFGCPVCGTGKGSFADRAMATSLETPNRWKCKTCGRWWGPGEEIAYNGEKFKITDDGLGWTIPEGLPGSGHKCYFAPAWRLYVLHIMFGSSRARSTIEGHYRPKGAVGSLATAYAITGDSKYAHKALLILTRFAQLYPTYDGNIDIGGPNKMGHTAWPESQIVDACCYSYNIVFDYLSKDNELIEFFEKKGHEDLDEDGKITQEDIRRNIAVSLFGYMYEWLLRVRKWTTADWTVGQSAQMARVGRAIENPDIVYEAIEGEKGFRDLMRKFCYNDGRFYYNSLAYDFAEPCYLSGVIFAVDGYCDGNKFKKPIDLFHDKSIIFERMTDYAYGIICNGRIPGIGDQTISREKVNPSTGRNPIQALAMVVHQYPWIAEGIENKDVFIKNMLDGISKMQPRSATEWILKIPEIEDIVEGTSFKPQPSRLFTDTGLGILRTNHKGIEQVHATLNYGIDGAGHSHCDQLALNIIAYGYELTINKGYPFTCQSSEKVPEWVQNTKAQNTVRIDGANQVAAIFGKPSIESAGKLYVYQDNELAGIVDGSNEEVYPGLADIYRRAIFLIKDSEHPFVVDIFNAAGGNIRDYQFHAQSDIEGKNFEIDFEGGTKLKRIGEALEYIDSRFIYDIVNIETKGDFRAHWWIGDKDNTGLVLNMIEDGTDRTVIACKGQAEGGDSPVPCDPHIIVRDEGKKKSRFISVIFPYHGKVPEYRIEKLAANGNVAALSIELGKKRYLVFYDLEGKKKHSFRDGKHKYVFKGMCGVILEQNGKVKAMSLSRGELLGRDKTVVKAKPMKEGKIVSIDEGEKSIIVKGIAFPEKLPCLMRLSDKAWTYRVIKAEKVGDKLKMYLDTFSFKDGFQRS